MYTSCPARSHICTSIGGTAGEGDVIGAKGLAGLGIARGAPKPLDDETKEELDPLAPKGVAGNKEPNAAAEAEEDVTAAKGLTDFGCANGADGFEIPKPPNGAPPPHTPGAAAPKPLDGEIKEELDPLAPEGVAGNENPSEKGALLAAAEFPKPAEAAPKPMLARLEESAGAEALCPP